MEGLAIVYATQKLRPYLLGKHFKIMVDHCALCVLNKRIPQSARLRRWAILLSEFDFEIVYTKGDLHKDIDCLSRAPVNDENDELLDDKIYAIITPKVTRSWIDAYELSNEDKEIHEEAKAGLNDYKIIDDVTYKKDKLYVPHNKRKALLAEAHDMPNSGHGGVKNTKERLEELYWPNMDTEIETYVKGCHPCQIRKIERARPAGSMNHFLALRPFELISIDTLGSIETTLKGKK